MQNILKKLKLKLYHSYLLFSAYLDSYILKTSKKSLMRFHVRRSDELIILGTGPSLTTLNLDVLKHIDSLSVNGYAKLVSEKDWPETDLYMIQDIEVFRRLQNDIKNLKTSKIFLSHLISFIFRNNMDLWQKYTIFRHHLLDHAYVESYENLNVKASTMPDCIVYDGYTVIYSAIQMAVALGYSSVYLLGVDANYSNDASQRNIIDIGKRDHTFASAGERIAFGIRELVDAYPELNIYNSSSTSSLTFLEFSKTVNGYEISS